MPLYDNDDPLAEEAPTLVALADLLAENAGAQAWSGFTGGTTEENKAATLAKIILGPHQGPWDGDQFTKTELEARGSEFQIWAPEEGGKQVVVNGTDVDAGGLFNLTARRQVKDSEAADLKDVYLFTLDCAAAIENGLAGWFVARNKPRLIGVNRVQGPAFGTKGAETMQGLFVFVSWQIPWGDSLGGPE